VVVMPAVVSGLRVRLTSGAEIEVAAGNLDVIRAVVGELARTSHSCRGRDSRSPNSLWGFIARLTVAA
jgi:hypothetical protein